MRVACSNHCSMGISEGAFFPADADNSYGETTSRGVSMTDRRQAVQSAKASTARGRDGPACRIPVIPGCPAKWRASLRLDGALCYHTTNGLHYRRCQMKRARGRPFDGCATQRSRQVSAFSERYFHSIAQKTHEGTTSDPKSGSKCGRERGKPNSRLECRRHAARCHGGDRVGHHI